MKKKWLALLLGCTLAMTCGLAGCGDSTDTESETASQETEEVAADDDKEDSNTDENAPEGNYIKLALNVYYNDADSDYYSNEPGSDVIYVTEEGQYTLTFDCATDLSTTAQGSGVTSLYNLTAIYIYDMGMAEGNQSKIKECNIMYDSVVVDGVELTITQTEPKSAIKSNGIFDTNDPINGWDGSQVEEVSMTSDHVANFTTLDHPTTISVTFTLSDMVWDE